MARPVQRRAVKPSEGPVRPHPLVDQRLRRGVQDDALRKAVAKELPDPTNFADVLVRRGPETHAGAIFGSTPQHLSQDGRPLRMMKGTDQPPTPHE